MYRLVIFDMDGTLLQGRTIFHIAEKKGFKKRLIEYLESPLQPYERTIEIAKLLKGISKQEMLLLFHEIPFRRNVENLISNLKQKKMIIALATDSYDIVANDIKERLKLDYAFANNLIFHDLICTGNVKLHNDQHVLDEVTKKIYSISKSTVLEHLCSLHKIDLKQCIAIGDGIVDCGMIKKAGLGVAVNASKEVNACADLIIDDLMEMLPMINGRK